MNWIWTKKQLREVVNKLEEVSWLQVPKEVDSTKLSTFITVIESELEKQLIEKVHYLEIVFFRSECWVSVVLNEPGPRGNDFDIIGYGATKLEALIAVALGGGYFSRGCPKDLEFKPWIHLLKQT